MTGIRRERASDPGMALLHALLAGAPGEAGIALVDMASTGWSSATFIGARHVIRLQGRHDPALAGWLARLPDAEFRLRGHLVADLAITSVDRRDAIAAIVIEVLTLEEA